MLKSYGVVGGGGGPCDYSVSPSPFKLDFGTLDFGTSDSGLTIQQSFSLIFPAPEKVSSSPYPAPSSLWIFSLEYFWNC